MTDQYAPALRQRFLEDMRNKGLQPKTQTMYLRAMRDFTRYLGHSPDSATPKELRAFQLDMKERGVGGLQNTAITTKCEQEIFARFFPTYEARLKTLSSVSEREHEDCYAVLSGVAHGTAIHSISTATKPQELVEEKATVSAVRTVFRDVAETISDINVACFESNWLSLPNLYRRTLQLGSVKSRRVSN